jgi:hypothetical protein
MSMLVSKGRKSQVTTKSFTPWSEFDPIEYVSRCYAQTIPPENGEIIRASIAGLLHRAIDVTLLFEMGSRHH